MHNHSLKSADDYLASAQPLPQNASAPGNKGALDFCRTQGALEVVAAAHADISIADAKSLTIGLEHSDDGLAFAPVGEAFTATAQGAPLTFDEGAILCRLAVPSGLKRHARLSIATTDAAAAGAVDAWLEYLAR